MPTCLWLIRLYCLSNPHELSLGYSFIIYHNMALVFNYINLPEPKGVIKSSSPLKFHVLCVFNEIMRPYTRPYTRDYVCMDNITGMTIYELYF